jgi:hypothetical protein
MPPDIPLWDIVFFLESKISKKIKKIRKHTSLFLSRTMSRALWWTTEKYKISRNEEEAFSPVLCFSKKTSSEKTVPTCRIAIKDDT